MQPNCILSRAAPAPCDGNRTFTLAAMRHFTSSLILIFLPACLFGAPPPAPQPPPSDDAVYEYQVGQKNWLTGEGVNLGNVLTPEIFFTGAWGMFEPGAGPGDFAASEHDPLVNGTLQSVEMHLLLNVDDLVTGGVYGFAHEAEGYELEAELEEAFLHYHLTEHLAIGGGQFLNALGFQNTRHLHGWDFVNQNLINHRMLNEGHLITQGGEVLVGLPRQGLLTLGGGGVLAHEHEHAPVHEEHAHGQEDEGEHHHLEADEAGFNDWVVSADARYRLAVDPSLTLSASFAAGENGFGRHTFLYGWGLQKVWNGHDHGSGGPDFCTGAVALRTEFLAREVEALREAGEADEEVDFGDFGFSTALHYGWTDQVTLSMRHDWVSAVEEAELADTHRISPAVTVFLDPGQRLQARLQYDFVRSDALESEHAGWFQLQWAWGGQGGSHHHCSH